MIVSVLFGAQLLGVLGALVAVPVAATIQIIVREYSVVKRLLTARGSADDRRRAGLAPAYRLAAPEERDGGGDAAADDEAGGRCADERRLPVLGQLACASR